MWRAWFPGQSSFEELDDNMHLGALIIAVLRNGLNLMNVSVSWQMVVTGVVIVAAVLVDVVRQRSMRR